MIEHVEHTEIGGVPVFWHGSSRPLTAVLLFRAGRVDEPLHQSGITHLVEHLALFDVGPTTFSYNGFVDALRTGFVTSGTPEEVSGFFSSVCRALRELPTDRLETERGVLLTEEASRPSSYLDELYGIRYGVSGYGVLGWKELGLRRVTAEEVRRWARERFTAENALMWINGDVPADLTLELPAGERVPVPEPHQQVALPLPGYVHSDAPGVALSAVGTRWAATRLTQAVAAARLHDQMRRERGLIYSATGSYDPLTAASVHISLAADSLPEHASDVAHAMLEDLRSIAADGVTEAELDVEVTRMETAFAHPNAEPAILDGYATNVLFDWPILLPHEAIAEAHAVAPADAARVARELLDSLLLVIPRETPLDDLPKIETPSDDPVQGTVMKPLGARLKKRQNKVILGEEGISVVEGATSVTARFGEIVAVVETDEGLAVLAADGDSLSVKPHLLSGGAEIIKALHANVDPDRFVPLSPEAAAYRELELIVDRDLVRRWAVLDELKILREAVGKDEAVLVLAEANRGVTSGLAAVTHRRLLFVNKPLRGGKDPVVVEIDRSELSGIATSASKLKLTTRDGVRVQLEDFVPRERLAQVAASLGGPPPPRGAASALHARPLLLAIAGLLGSFMGGVLFGLALSITSIFDAWLGSGLGPRVQPPIRRWSNWVAVVLGLVGTTIWFTRRVF